MKALSHELYRCIHQRSRRVWISGTVLVLILLAIPLELQARILSDIEYASAARISIERGSEKSRECRIATEIIKATDDRSPCSPEDLAYGSRVLASYRAAIAVVQDSEFMSNNYGAVASSQSPSDLNEPMADQAACAVALSDTYSGGVDHPHLPTHPPSCSDDMVAYGIRLIRDYQKAINAEDKLP